MQKLIKKFKPRITYLVNQYPNLSFSFDNHSLSINIPDVLKKLGFTVFPQEKRELSSLVKNLVFWLRNHNLVLLQYRPKSSTESLVNLLRAIKTSVPDISFENLIPVFIASYSSKKQLEAFRLLSGFNIQYVSYLTPNVVVDKNIEEILQDLFNFSEMLKRGVPTDKKIRDEKKDLELEKIGEYQKLIAQGEELMRDFKYEEAIDFFSRGIDLNPDYNAFIDRGDAYYKVCKYVLALQDFKKAKYLQQSEPEPYTKIGTCCLKLIKESMKKKDTNGARKWFELGIVHFRNAESIIADFINENKDCPERLLTVPYAPIISALSEGDIRGLGLGEMECKISDLIARVIEKTDFADYLNSEIDIDTRIDQAILFTRNKDYEKAEKIFKQVVNDDPSQVGPVFNNFAIELRKNGQEGRAFDTYIELLSHNIPDKDIIIENLKTAGLNHASRLRESFKQKEAVGVYKIILKNNPSGKEWVLCDLAMTFLELQNPTQASSRLMEAIYINPSLMSSKKFGPYKDLTNLKDEMVDKLSFMKYIFG